MQSLLFTGATGFLGTNLLPSLKKQYSVDTLASDSSADYNINLVTDEISLRHRYDIVFHAAGKAHVLPKNESEVKLFFDINFEGTKKLCNALEKSGIPKSFVFVSTVAVYGCDSGELISEEHSLDGSTPYAKSKILAEKYLDQWCKVHDVILTILRPSLIAGKNPPGNLGSMIKGLSSGRYLSIAGGKSRKSVVMADDLANILSVCVNRGGIYNICDSNHPSFCELEELICRQLGKKKPLNIPYCIAFMLALFGNILGEKSPFNLNRLNKITKSLTFSNTKLKTELGYVPSDVLSNFQIH